MPPLRDIAFAEARRVLRRGGRFLFSVWDHIEHNAFAQTVTDALASEFAHDPPRFMARTPHGYHDLSIIARDLANGGWRNGAQFDTLTYRSRAASARDVAIAYCQGTPLRNEIEEFGTELVRKQNLILFYRDSLTIDCSHANDRHYC